MTELKLGNIRANHKRKAKEAACKGCGKTIEKGSIDASAVYSDGFTTRLYGAFHLTCFEELAKTE